MVIVSGRSAFRPYTDAGLGPTCSSVTLFGPLPRSCMSSIPPWEPWNSMPALIGSRDTPCIGESVGALVCGSKRLAEGKACHDSWAQYAAASSAPQPAARRDSWERLQQASQVELRMEASPEDCAPPQASRSAARHFGLGGGSPPRSSRRVERPSPRRMT